MLGVTHRHELGFGSGYGFDAIAIALLGRTNPFGVVAAAILFGGLKSGATQMQFNTQISGSIISVVQGLVLLFVSADVIIRWLYRLRVRSERGTLTLSPAAAAAVAAAGQVETLARDYVSPLGVDLTAAIARWVLPARRPRAREALKSKRRRGQRMNLCGVPIEVLIASLWLPPCAWRRP